MSGKHPRVLSAAANYYTATLGPWLLSLIVVTFSLGLLSSQATIYFRSFPHEKRWLKGLVIVTCILSVIHAVILFIPSWQWYVTNYGDLSLNVKYFWTFSAEPIIAQLCVSCPQLFFAYRCFVLTGSKPVFILLICGMLASLVIFTVFGTQAIEHLLDLGADQRFAVPALSINLLTDLIITVLTTWKLLAAKKGAYISTNSGLSRLLRITWEAAVPPALSTIVSIVTFVTLSSESALVVFFATLTPSLYVFSLMYTLNSRPLVRRTFAEVKTTTVPNRGLSSTTRSNGQQTSWMMAFAPMGDERSVTGRSTEIVSEDRSPPKPPREESESRDSMATLKIDLDKWNTGADDSA